MEIRHDKTLVNVIIQPSSERDVAEINQPATEGCPGKVYLIIWIRDEAHKTNNFNSIFQNMGPFSVNVRKLALVNFNEDGLAFLQKYNAWIKEHMPDLESISCTFDVSKKASGVPHKRREVWTIAGQLRDMKWPKKLSHIAMILTGPNEAFDHWEVVYPQRIHNVDCFILDLKIEGKLKSFISSVKDAYAYDFRPFKQRSGGKLPPFAHSIKCTPRPPESSRLIRSGKKSAENDKISQENEKNESSGESLNINEA